MSGMINFNAQIAPMEHVEKVVRQEQEHGLVKQEALLQSAAQRLSRDNEQVQKTVKSRKDRRVESRTDEDEEARKKGRNFAGKKPGQDSGPDGEDLAEQAKTGVWSGNIVNLKV